MRRKEPSRKVSVPPDFSDGNNTANALSTEMSSETSQPTRAGRSIALIDPKPLTRQAISEMLTNALPDCVIVAASSCEELLKIRCSPTGSPSLVIFYTRSANVMDALVQDALTFVRLQLADTPVILLSDWDDVDGVVDALACGVRGYILTSVDPEVAFAALRLVHAGGTFVLAPAPRSPTATLNTWAARQRRELQDDPNLTPRELLVINLLRDGTPNKLIAAELNLNESTVKVHVRNIMKKLNVINRTQAASAANRLFGPQEEHAAVVGLLRSPSDAAQNSQRRSTEADGE